MPWSIEAGLETRMGAKRFRVLRRREKDGKVLKYPVEDRKVTFEAPEEKCKGLRIWIRRNQGYEVEMLLNTRIRDGACG